MLALNSQTGKQLWYTATNFKPPVLGSGVAAPLERDGLAALYLPGPCTAMGCSIDTIAIVQMSTGTILWQKDIQPEWKQYQSPIETNRAE
jgi:hypothetical protein